MDKKNCNTKNAADCQRALRRQSGNAGQRWVQGFSSLILHCRETGLVCQTQLYVHGSLQALATVYRG